MLSGSVSSNHPGVLSACVTQDVSEQASSASTSLAIRPGGIPDNEAARGHSPSLSSHHSFVPRRLSQPDNSFLQPLPKCTCLPRLHRQLIPVLAPSLVSAATNFLVAFVNGFATQVLSVTMDCLGLCADVKPDAKAYLFRWGFSSAYLDNLDASAPQCRCRTDSQHLLRFA